MRTSLLSLGIFIVILFSPILLFSQNQNESETSIGDKIETNSSIMFNLSYTNNNMEYLSGTSEKIPTLFANTSYFHKSGIYAGGSYANYFSDTIPSTEIDLQVGYQKYFTNGFDIDLSYNWHKFKGDSLLAGLNYDHSIDLMMGMEISKFYISTDLNYKLGQTNNFFFDLSLSRFIQINQLFSKNDVLLISPGISLSFSTDYWLYEDMSSADKISTFSNLSSAGYSYESFSYEGFNVFVPVSYGIKNVYLTVSWLYKIPGDKYKFMGWENQSGFMLSLTYFLNFSTK
ncbi:MAG TPA: hypothetical protein DCG75_00470 [Bacteroidales bacterium]|nr:hypothetical protein [Bacteroidales bacterium]